MVLTGNRRAIAGAAGTATAGGLTVVLFGIVRASLPHTVGGTCITLTALTVLALILIRQWIVDTNEERHFLSVAQREAQAERARYFAAQAALENEQGRAARDRAAQRRADAARLQAEREAMQAEFDEKRAALIAETIEEIGRMAHSGKLAPEAKPTGNLIQFPHQQAQPHPERARTREH